MHNHVLRLKDCRRLSCLPPSLLSIHSLPRLPILSASSQEVPDASDTGNPAPDAGPMKQSNERMCSYDHLDESYVIRSPASHASSLHDEHLDTRPDVEAVIPTSSYLLEQLSGPKVQSSSGLKPLQGTSPIPNYHLLQQLKKELILPSTATAGHHCDQPLDLSFNSTRAQQQPLTASSTASKAVVPEQKSLLLMPTGAACDPLITTPPSK